MSLFARFRGSAKDQAPGPAPSAGPAPALPPAAPSPGTPKLKGGVTASPAASPSGLSSPRSSSSALSPSTSSSTVSAAASPSPLGKGQLFARMEVKHPSSSSFSQVSDGGAKPTLSRQQSPQLAAASPPAAASSGFSFINDAPSPSADTEQQLAGDNDGAPSSGSAFAFIAATSDDDGESNDASPEATNDSHHQSAGPPVDVSTQDIPASVLDKSSSISAFSFLAEDASVPSIPDPASGFNPAVNVGLAVAAAEATSKTASSEAYSPSPSGDSKKKKRHNKNLVRPGHARGQAGDDDEDFAEPQVPELRPAEASALPSAISEKQASPAPDNSAASAQIGRFAVSPPVQQPQPEQTVDSSPSTPQPSVAPQSLRNESAGDAESPKPQAQSVASRAEKHPQAGSASDGHRDQLQEQHKEEDPLVLLQSSLAEQLSELAARREALEEEQQQITMSQMQLFDRLVAIGQTLQETEAAQAQAVSSEEFELADDLNAKMEGISAEIKQLRKKLPHLHESLRNVLAAKVTLGEEEAELRAMSLSALSAVHEAEEAELLAFRQEKDRQATKTRHRILSEKDRISRALSHIQLDMDHVTRKEQTLDEALKEQTSGHSEEIGRLEASRERIRDEIRQLMARIQELQDHEREITSAINVEQGKVDAVREALHEESARLEDDKRRIEADKLKHAREMEAINADQARYEAFFSEYEEQVRVKKARLAAIRSQVTKSRSELSMLEKENRAMADFLLERKERDQQRHKSEQELERLREKVALFEEELKNLTSKLLAHQAVMSQLKKSVQDIDARLPELEEEKKIAVAGRFFKEASRVSNEIKIKNAEKTQALEECERVKAELDALNQTLQHSKQDSDAASKELEDKAASSERDKLSANVQTFDVLKAQFIAAKKDRQERLARLIAAEVGAVRAESQELSLKLSSEDPVAFDDSFLYESYASAPGPDAAGQTAPDAALALAESPSSEVDGAGLPAPESSALAASDDPDVAGPSDAAMHEETGADAFSFINAASPALDDSPAPTPDDSAQGFEIGSNDDDDEDSEASRKVKAEAVANDESAPEQSEAQPHDVDVSGVDVASGVPAAGPEQSAGADAERSSVDQEESAEKEALERLAKKSRLQGRMEELTAQLADIDAQINTAVEVEDFERAAELEEQRLSVQQEQTAVQEELEGL